MPLTLTWGLKACLLKISMTWVKDEVRLMEAGSSVDPSMRAGCSSCPASTWRCRRLGSIGTSSVGGDMLPKELYGEGEGELKGCGRKNIIHLTTISSIQHASLTWEMLWVQSMGRERFRRKKNCYVRTDQEFVCWGKERLRDKLLSLIPQITWMMVILQ